MTVYAGEHQDALDAVREAGAAVTFTAVTKTRAAVGGSSSSAVATVEGRALRVRGNPKRYEVLSLIESQAPSLFFVPTTIGQTPEPGMTCVWGGQTYTVRDADPLAPDGTAIAVRVIVGR